jgi:hypothetical protein
VAHLWLNHSLLIDGGAMKNVMAMLAAVWMLASAALGGVPDLGIDAPLNGKPVFLKDDRWNQDVSALPVDPASAAIIARIGAHRPLHPDFGTTYNGRPNGIPYIVVPGDTKKLRVSFVEYGDESDQSPYPITPNAPIEGGAGSDGDCHVLVIDRDNWMLYELWHAKSFDNGSRWQAGSGAIFDLTKGSARPLGWTSADAAGLPIFPGLVRYDEVIGAGEIRHALRFTVRRSRRAYVAPARHFASNSNDPSLPPMGMRVRLKSQVDISGFSPAVRVILTALKRYGMILADNGSDWFISGAPDPRWDDEALGQLSRIKGSDLEVVRMGEVMGR